MRILQLTSHLRPGGVTRSVVALTEGLLARGHAVVVASGGGEAENDLARMGAAVWRTDLDTSVDIGWRVWRASVHLAQRVGREPFDIAHAHTRVAQVAANRLWRKRGVPYVATWHGYYTRRLGRRLWPCTGHATVAISGPVAAHIENDFGVPEERIALIPHGIRPERIARLSAEARRAGREALGIEPRSFLVGSVARLVPSKGVDNLLRAAPLLLREHPDACVAVVGDGPQRPQLEAVAAELGVAQQVRFLGNVPADSVYPLLDAFVFLPTDAEGFGLTALEATAAGIPLVAVRRGPGAEWLLDRLGSSVDVPPDDPDALARALGEVRDNPSAAQARVEFGRAAVQRQFLYSAMIDATEALYRRVAEGRSRS